MCRVFHELVFAPPHLLSSHSRSVRVLFHLARVEILLAYAYSGEYACAHVWLGDKFVCVPASVCACAGGGVSVCLYECVFVGVGGVCEWVRVCLCVSARACVCVCLRVCVCLCVTSQTQSASLQTQQHAVQHHPPYAGRKHVRDVLSLWSRARV